MNVPVSVDGVEPQNIHRHDEQVTCLGRATGGTWPSLETQYMNVPKLHAILFDSPALFFEIMCLDLLSLRAHLVPGANPSCYMEYMSFQKVPECQAPFHGPC